MVNCRHFSLCNLASSSDEAIHVQARLLYALVNILHAIEFAIASWKQGCRHMGASHENKLRDKALDFLIGVCLHAELFALPSCSTSNQNQLELPVNISLANYNAFSPAMDQTRALNALAPYVALAKSATSPRAAADLITQATSAPNTYVFAELLAQPNVQKLKQNEEYAHFYRLGEAFAWGTWESYKRESMQ